MKKFLVVLICLVALISCSRTSEPPKLEKQKITIAQFGHVFLYIPVYVAQNKGFFAEEGLEVQLVSTGGDEKTFAAVASNSAQFGVADPTFTAIAREKGQGGKVVASVVNGVPFWGITFKKNLKSIDDSQGLAGLRIATYTAPSTNYTVMKKILQGSGKPIKAKIVEGAFGSLVAMLKVDKADVAMELEPVASIAVADGATIVFSMARAFGEFALTGLTATDSYIEKNPRIVQAAIDALSKAMKYVHNDFEGTLIIAKKEFPEVSEPILRNALKRIVEEGTVPKSTVLSKEAWDKAISLRKEVGDIKGTGAFEENVDMRFAEKAGK
jgi:NitT/TauT family transport system substrate-binding protein